MSSRVMNALSRAANKPSNRSRGPSRSLLLPLMTVLLVKAAAQGAANTPSTAVAVDMMQQQQQQKPQVQLIRRSLVADSAAAATSADTAAAAASTDARSIPVYGNWCGPNYGSGTPVDELDDCCRGHDNCYDSTAVYNHCSCDQQLVRCLNKIVSIKSNELVKRAIRASMVTYFDNAACRCSMETDMCMPVKNCVCSG